MKGAKRLERMTPEQDQRISAVVSQERSRLVSFIRRRVPDPRDAEDILQEVFYELVEANRLLMPIEHVTGWLFRVARNRITDLFRKKEPENFRCNASLIRRSRRNGTGVRWAAIECCASRTTRHSTWCTRIPASDTGDGQICQGWGDQKAGAAPAPWPYVPKSNVQLGFRFSRAFSYRSEPKFWR